MAPLTLPTTHIGASARGACAGSRAVRPRAVRICCSRADQQESSSNAGFLAVSFAAAALLSSSAAQAGVILEKKELKKPALFDSTPKPAKEVSKKESSEGFKGPSFKAPAIEFDPSGLVLPVSVVGLAVAGVAATKVDAGFEDFLSRTVIRDSNVLGVGYEEVLKSGVAPKATGTKRVKAGGLPKKK